MRLALPVLLVLLNSATGFARPRALLDLTVEVNPDAFNAPAESTTTELNPPTRHLTHGEWIPIHIPQDDGDFRLSPDPQLAAVSQVYSQVRRTGSRKFQHDYSPVSSVVDGKYVTGDEGTDKAEMQSHRTFYDDLADSAKPRMSIEDSQGRSEWVADEKLGAAAQQESDAGVSEGVIPVDDEGTIHMMPVNGSDPIDKGGNTTSFVPEGNTVQAATMLTAELSTAQAELAWEMGQVQDDAEGDESESGDDAAEGGSGELGGEVQTEAASGEQGGETDSEEGEDAVDRAADVVLLAEAYLEAVQVAATEEDALASETLDDAAARNSTGKGAGGEDVGEDEGRTAEVLALAEAYLEAVEKVVQHHDDPKVLEEVTKQYEEEKAEEEAAEEGKGGAAGGSTEGSSEGEDADTAVDTPESFVPSSENVTEEVVDVTSMRTHHGPFDKPDNHTDDEAALALLDDYYEYSEDYESDATRRKGERESDSAESEAEWVKAAQDAMKGGKDGAEDDTELPLGDPEQLALNAEMAAAAAEVDSEVVQANGTYPSGADSADTDAGTVTSTTQHGKAAADAANSRDSMTGLYVVNSADSADSNQDSRASSSRERGSTTSSWKGRRGLPRARPATAGAEKLPPKGSPPKKGPKPGAHVIVVEAIHSSEFGHARSNASQGEQAERVQEGNQGQENLGFAAAKRARAEAASSSKRSEQKSRKFAMSFPMFSNQVPVSSAAGASSRGRGTLEGWTLWLAAMALAAMAAGLVGAVVGVMLYIRSQGSGSFYQALKPEDTLPVYGNRRY